MFFFFVISFSHKASHNRCFFCRIFPQIVTFVSNFTDGLILGLCHVSQIGEDNKPGENTGEAVYAGCGYAVSARKQWESAFGNHSKKQAKVRFCGKQNGSHFEIQNDFAETCGNCCWICCSWRRQGGHRIRRPQSRISEWQRLSIPGNIQCWQICISSCMLLCSERLLSNRVWLAIV